MTLQLLVILSVLQFVTQSSSTIESKAQADLSKSQPDNSLPNLESNFESIAEEDVDDTPPIEEEPIVSPKDGPTYKREDHKPKKWDHWSKWSDCSVTCGVGKLTRWRHCVSGGCAPGEKEAQIKTCTLAPCNS